MASMKKSGLLIAALFLIETPALFVAAGAQQSDVHEQREVSRGVSYTHIKRTTPAGEPWSIHVLEMSRTENKVELRSVKAAEDNNGMQRERPTVMAQRAAASGLNVVAVVNGDYDIAVPYLGVSDGLSMTAGAISTTGKPAWPAMAVTFSGEPLIGVPKVEMVLESRRRSWTIAALNKPLGSTWGTGPYLYTREFREAMTSVKPFLAVRIWKLSRKMPLKADGTVRGTVQLVFGRMNEMVLPADGLVLAETLTADGTATTLGTLRTGDHVKLRIRVQMNGKKKIRDVVGGFPILVEGRKKHIVGEPKASLAQRHPRTAACYNAQKIIFVVVDGRQPQLSVGMTLDELADLMVELGCAMAMNTDGGGSSVMAVRAESNGAELRIVNSPSDGQERGRGNAWIVIQRR